jgi:ADP-ribosylglycohydrolase
MEKKKRIKQAKKALIGVSIGDAFGESFFGETDEMVRKIHSREIPKTEWAFTDDTVMSIAILEALEEKGVIDQDDLIQKFIVNHDLDFYGKLKQVKIGRMFRKKRLKDKVRWAMVPL